MIEFIPLKNYYAVYIYSCLFLLLFNLIHAYTVSLNDPKNLKFLRTAGFLLLILMTFYLGLRPVSGRYFGDMMTYDRYYTDYVHGAAVTTTKDVTFHWFMKISSYFVNNHVFFLIIALLYIFPMYYISKVHFKTYWFYAFIMFIVSFSFYSYGTNGIRNGVASSLFLLGLCFYNKKITLILCFILAMLFHKTMLLPILAFSLTYFYNNPKTYLKAWLLAIPLSLFLGGIFITLFTSLGFGDDRLAEYLSGDMENVSTGFRWDFLFYSGFPVFSAWYFILKKNFKDPFYNQVVNTYLICNAFWILVIRANFSNRFAYLSWFIMAFIIIYPLLKQQFFKNQQVVIGLILSAYFMFTFLMFFIYYAK